MKHPYSKNQPYQMWRQAVTQVEPHLIDPVHNPKFQITRNLRVGTAGSCFAQHIARKISEIGFNYFVPESDDTLSEQEKIERNFGIFSARYGNLYTVEQLYQLFQEVFDGRKSAEKPWKRPDGQFVDPCRPQVEPAGYKTAKDVVVARAEHLKHVERVFRESELFVFTLGLTEAWRSKADATVFPLAPGVVAGSYDEKKYEFHNFSVTEVIDTLNEFLERLREVNPSVKVLLTVSPVPLIATYEKRNVLVSTVYSKSVLRVAAQATSDVRDWVDYFPSYEIITGSATGGMYYETDQREVAPIGVVHAMRCFVQNYVESNTQNATPVRTRAERISELQKASDVVCDEEVLGSLTFSSKDD